MTTQVPFPDDAAAPAGALAALIAEAEAGSVAALSQVDTLTGQLTATEQQNQLLTAELAAATATQPTLIGTAAWEGSTAKDIADMDAKFGAKPPVTRLYWPNAPGQSPVTDGRKVVGSYKTPVAAGPASAWSEEMWRRFFQHEIDSKIVKDTYTLPAWQAEMTAQLELNIPGLGVCLTADCFTNKKKNPDDYLIDGVTHLGVDFDGVSNATTYHSYLSTITTVAAYAKDHGLTWGVPEFGANRDTSDTTGTVRAAWMALTIGAFVKAGAEYVCWWESSGQAGSTATTPAEIATLSALFQV